MSDDDYDHHQDELEQRRAREPVSIATSSALGGTDDGPDTVERCADCRAMVVVTAFSRSVRWSANKALAKRGLELVETLCDDCQATRQVKQADIRDCCRRAAEAAKQRLKASVRHAWAEKEDWSLVARELGDEVVRRLRGERERKQGGSEW